MPKRISLRGVILVGFLAIAACAPFPTAPPTGAAPPTGTAGFNPGPVPLGAYERSSASAVARSFAEALGRRYAPDAPLSAITADLSANAFSCRASRHRLGDPPDQVCRRSAKAGDCDHTWQIYLYDDRGATRLSRVRAVYDRACGPDPLLGGPA